MAFEFLSEESGIGRHTFYLSTSELITATKWAKLALFFFVIISWMIKISISVFIVRLANNRSLKWSLTILMSIFTMMTLAWVIVFLAQCRPIQAVWDSTIDGSCWSLNVSVILDDIQGGELSTPVGFVLDTNLYRSRLCYSHRFGSFPQSRLYQILESLFFQLVRNLLICIGNRKCLQVSSVLCSAPSVVAIRPQQHAVALC